MAEGRVGNQELGLPVMNEHPTGRSDEMERTLAAKRLVKATVRVLVGQGIGAAVAVGAAGLVLHIPARRLLVPFALLWWCGPVLSSLLIAAWPARTRPKAYAIRIAVGIGAYLVMLMLALVYSGIWLGVLSKTEALGTYLPSLVNVVVLVSIVLYFVLRRVFEARQSGRRASPADSHR
jgi:hypothetical protein